MGSLKFGGEREALRGKFAGITLVVSDQSAVGGEISKF